MRRFVIVNVFLLMVVMVFSVRWASTAGPRPSQNENDDIKLAEAQVQAIAAARDSFTKHRTLNALSEPSTTITVATKRVNDSKAAVAFGIRTNNPSLASDNLEIEVNFQPVAMTSAQSLKKLGAPSKGVFSIGKSDNNASEISILKETSYVLTLPKEANAIGFEIHVIAQGRDYGLNFVKGVTEEATAVTAERGPSLPQSGSMSRNDASLSHANRAPMPFSCGCTTVRITCGTHADSPPVSGR